jgi:hypothetical protein
MAVVEICFLDLCLMTVAVKTERRKEENIETTGRSAKECEVRNQTKEKCK